MILTVKQFITIRKSLEDDINYIYFSIYGEHGKHHGFNYKPFKDACNWYSKWKTTQPKTRRKKMADESFVDLYLDYTKELESSTAFFRWSAYACVAALLRDNVFLPDGPGFIFPNIYVLLLADSAMHRKARGPNLASEIIAEVGNTKLIRGRTSIQSVIEDLGSVTSSKTTGSPIKGGSCIMVADELASFLVGDPQAVPILTDIYDYRKEWTSSLKGTGKTKISNLCVTLLAGSNEEHLKMVYTSAAVFGGLLGRTFFVKPDEERAGNPLFGDNAGNGHYNIKPLMIAAKKLAKIKGQFTVDPAAQKVYEDWYLPWRRACMKTTDRTGVLGRLHSSVKKIAMILAISETYDLVIRRNHVSEAIDRCVALLPNYESYSMSSGKSGIATAGTILLAMMNERKGKSITRKEFLQVHWVEVEADMLDRTVITLETAGYLVSCPRGSEVSYTMTPMAVTYFKNKLQGEK